VAIHATGFRPRASCLASHGDFLPVLPARREGRFALPRASFTNADGFTTFRTPGADRSRVDAGRVGDAFDADADAGWQIAPYFPIV